MTWREHEGADGTPYTVYGDRDGDGDGDGSGVRVPFDRVSDEALARMRAMQVERAREERAYRRAWVDAETLLVERERRTARLPEQHPWPITHAENSAAVRAGAHAVAQARWAAHLARLAGGDW